MDSKSIYDLIKSVSFFENFTETEKKSLFKLHTDVVRYKVAEIIIKEGDFDENFYILLKGSVRVVKLYPKEKLITKLNPGALFGELSWVGKRARITSVVAETEVIAFVLDLNKVGKFDLVIREKLKDKIISNLITRLEDMNEQLAKTARR